MADSFTLSRSEVVSRRDLKVLVTGAAGRIGSYFAKHSRGRYTLRLMVRDEKDAKAIGNYGEIVICDLGDRSGLEKVCRGMHSVLHLAADPNPDASWESLLATNIAGTYNLFQAAKAAGCKRVVYASSIHAISGYPADVQVKTDSPVNPGDLYGVSKCFGEALGRYMAEQEGLSCIAVRIGAFQPAEAARDPKSLQMLDAWVSHRDLTQLLQKCLEAEHVQFAIVHGLSDNRFKRMDISDARELLGYEPKDDLTLENPKLKPLSLPKVVRAHSKKDQ